MKIDQFRYDITCIMPSYNTSRYIKRAILSIVEQTTALRVQVIVVDDGSTDNTVLHVRSLQKLYDNIELFQQSHSGPATARNFAIKQAKSRYVMFVDSDDLLPDGAINNLHSSIESNSGEIAIGMFRAFAHNRTWIHESMTRFLHTRINSTNLDKMPELINNMSPCNKIYLLEFIRDNNIHFLQDAYLREDIYFVSCALYRAKYIAIIPDIVYLYRSRGAAKSSLTSLVDERVFRDIFRVSSELDLEQQSSIYANNQKIFNYRYVNELNALMYRLIPFAQDNLAIDSILHGSKELVCKLDDSAFESISPKYRAALYKIKNGEFEAAKALMVMMAPKRRGTVEKLGARVYALAKKSASKLVELVSRVFYCSGTMEDDVWLIGEKLGQGGDDNAYQFFLYCRANFPKKPIYFVADKKNLPDYAREHSRYIVEYGSLKNLTLAMAAKVYIFSDGHRDIYPYSSIIEKLYDSKLSVFLQHGIFALKKSEYYMSYEVARRGEKFDLFVVSSKKERGYVVDQLGYKSETIIVSGLARFDRLYQNQHLPTQRKILFVPTWRQDLRYLSEDLYLKSRFHNKIEAFVSDSLLNRVLKQHNYTLHVCFHHAMARFSRHYNSSEHILFSNMDQIDLYSELITSVMLITDYSSIAFDMAYINRPVAFYQFDLDEFLSVEGGSFIEYKEELCGLSSHKHEDIVQEIEYNIAVDFKVRNKYAKISSLFFDHKDANSSKRIFDAITQAGRSS